MPARLADTKSSPTSISLGHRSVLAIDQRLPDGTLPESSRKSFLVVQLSPNWHLANQTILVSRSRSARNLRTNGSYSLSPNLSVHGNFFPWPTHTVRHARRQLPRPEAGLHVGVRASSMPPTARIRSRQDVLHTHMHTYIRAYLPIAPTDLHTEYVYTPVRASVHAYMHAFLHTCIDTHTYIHAYRQTYLPTRLRTIH